MDSTNVTSVAKGINEYGAGTVAIAILFVMVIVLFGVLIKMVSDNNTNHRKEMIPVLKALTESLDTLSETQMALKDQLIDRINTIGKQSESTHILLETHVRDCSRIETMVNVIQPSILKTEERTRSCIERRRSGDGPV